MKPEIANKIEEYKGKQLVCRNRHLRAPHRPEITRRNAVDLANYIDKLEEQAYALKTILYLENEIEKSFQKL